MAKKFARKRKRRSKPKSWRKKNIRKLGNKLRARRRVKKTSTVKYIYFGNPIVIKDSSIEMKMMMNEKVAKEMQERYSYMQLDNARLIEIYEQCSHGQQHKDVYNYEILGMRLTSKKYMGVNEGIGGYPMFYLFRKSPDKEYLMQTQYRDLKIYFKAQYPLNVLGKKEISGYKPNLVEKLEVAIPDKRLINSEKMDMEEGPADTAVEFKFYVRRHYKLGGGYKIGKGEEEKKGDAETPRRP